MIWRQCRRKCPGRCAHTIRISRRMPLTVSVVRAARADVRSMCRWRRGWRGRGNCLVWPEPERRSRRQISVPFKQRRRGRRKQKIAIQEWIQHGAHPEGGRCFLCADPCRGNMPLRRRTGRAASRGRWFFPTRLRRPVQRKYAAEAAHGSRGEQGKKALPCSISIRKCGLTYTILLKIAAY